MTKTVPALVVLLMLCSIVTTNGEVHLQPRESRTSTVIKTSTSLPEEPEKLSDNSVIHACAGRDLSLPLIASPSSPYVISEVKWFHESKSPAMIAVAADGRFLSTPAYTGRVEQTTNAGITLTELTSSDAGNYSVEIWVYNGEEDISLWKLSFNVFVAAHCPHDNSGDVDGTVDEAELHGCKANQEDKIRDLQKTLKDQKSCSLMGGRPFEDLCYFYIHKKKTWQDAVLTVLTTTQAMLMGQWRKPSKAYEELKINDLQRILKDQKAHCLHYGSGDVKVTVDEAELQNCKAKQAHLEHKMSDMVRTVGDLARTVRDLRRTVKALNDCSLKGGKRFQDYCYVYVGEEKTGMDAKATCEGMSAHLVEVYSADIDRFLQSFITLPGRCGRKDIWLGLNDRASEGHFVWPSTQTSPSYTNWNQGEPNNNGRGEDCVYKRVESGWNDNPCWIKMKFVCQFRID